MAFERYQLRLRQGTTFDDVLRGVTHAVWVALKGNPRLKELAPEIQPGIAATLRHVLEPHVTAYDTCGLQVVCDEAVLRGPWMAPDEPVPQGEGTRRLQLEVVEGLEGLLQGLVRSIEQLIVRTVGPGCLTAEVAEALTVAIRRDIGRYIFVNLLCGMTQLCKVAVPQEPWEEATTS